jgi:hypothetical protein
MEPSSLRIYAGDPIVQISCWDPSAVNWNKGTANGYSMFEWEHSGYCLAIHHTYDDGAPAFLSPCNPYYTDQHWMYATP